MLLVVLIVFVLVLIGLVFFFIFDLKWCGFLQYVIERLLDIFEIEN